MRQNSRFFSGQFAEKTRRKNDVLIVLWAAVIILVIITPSVLVTITRANQTNQKQEENQHKNQQHNHQMKLSDKRSNGVWCSLFNKK